MDTASDRALPASVASGDGGDGHGHDHAAGVLVPAAGLSSRSRHALVRRAQRLNVVTIAWNFVEGVVALGAGLMAGSISLVAFGLDSAIEMSAALILAWRLGRERRGGCMQQDDRMATRAIAVSFAALALYVAVGSTLDLVTAARPDASIPGVVLAALSVSVMPVLARAKRRLAPALGSRAVEADAAQTNLCALLSVVLLLGLTANAGLGWRWADPAAGLVIAALAANEGIRTWRVESLADTCCV